VKLDTNSLAHMQWNCKYHIVFVPKYRRQVIYGKTKADMGIMLRKLCEYKGVEILEAEACKDHIHMLFKEVNGYFLPILWSQPLKFIIRTASGYLFSSLADLSRCVFFSRRSRE